MQEIRVNLDAASQALLSKDKTLLRKNLLTQWGIKSKDLRLAPCWGTPPGAVWTTALSSVREDWDSGAHFCTKKYCDVWQSLDRILIQTILQYITRVSGYILKYPLDGRRVFAMAKERYFSVVVPSSWTTEETKCLNLTWSQIDRVSLCYWSDAESSTQNEPLGIIPVASIIHVEHDHETQGDIVQIRATSMCRYSRKMKATVERFDNFALTLTFASIKEAECWASDLKFLVGWFVN
eukprot:CAMPEP_0169231316 /NCGR_PEP_ID=MMETSP1016-20121227/26431_1 /TAXON_ID=342587 /ORGANISM="Karlodinium micrum, Strain CCMP2283" /LENGTH=236 /DNA_ID=CAMNT_0009310411 /DNA_START=68 /DNA_END=778 /DNA_ORIENTATION=+